MKILTKKALVFICAIAVVFCGICVIFTGAAKNGEKPVSRFDTDVIIDFSGVDDKYWLECFNEDTDKPEGDGTEQKPYSITTPEQLAWIFSKLPLITTRLYIELQNDIDLSAHFWTSPSNVNNIVFDGQGHTISKVNINDDSGESSGFFGDLQISDIKNLNLDNPQVYSLFKQGSTGYGIRYAGCFAGQASFVTFDGCTVTSGKVILDFQGYNSVVSLVCGSIVASAQYSSIKNCSADAVVFQSAAEENLYGWGMSADSYIGGLAGDLGKLSSIENSTFTGKVIHEDFQQEDSTNYSRVGGLVGHLSVYDHTIINSSFSGEINSYSYNADSVVGGIVGEAESGLVLINCYSIGRIYSYSRGNEKNSVCGGLAGKTFETDIRNSYVIMDIKVDSADIPYVGGFIGFCDNLNTEIQLSIDNCYVSVSFDLSENITNYDNIKYLVGSGNSSISNSYFNGDNKIKAKGVELSTGEEFYKVPELSLKTPEFVNVLNQVARTYGYTEWDIDSSESGTKKNDGFPYFADQTFADIIEVTFDYQYDNKKTPLNETIGNKYRLPVHDNRPGYVFGGWHTKKGTDNDWGKKITADETCDGEYKTLYAKWNEVEFTIKTGDNCEINPVSSDDPILWSDLSSYTIDVVGGKVQHWLIGINGGQPQLYSQSTDKQLFLEVVIKNLYSNRLNYNDPTFEISFSAEFEDITKTYYSVKIDITNKDYGVVNFNDADLNEGENEIKYEEGTTVNFSAFVKEADILKYKCVVEVEDSAGDWVKFTKTSFPVDEDYNLKVTFSKIEYTVKIDLYNPVAKAEITDFAIKDLLLITIPDNYIIAAGNSITLINRYNIYQNYKFVNFTMEGSNDNYSDSSIQMDFDSILKYANNNKEIIIKANFIRVFSISIQNQQSLRGKAIVRIEVNGAPLSSSNMRFDEGSDILVKITVLTAVGYKINKISFDGGSTAIPFANPNEFIYSYNSKNNNLIFYIDISKIDSGNVTVKLVSNTIGSAMQPKLNSNKYIAEYSNSQANEYLFNSDEQNIGIVSVGQNTVYLLKGWNIYLNGDLVNDVSGIFELDEFGNIQNFNLNDLVAGLTGNIEVKIEAVWKKIAGIEIAYVGDNSVGQVVVYYSKDGGLTWESILGNDLLSLQTGRLVDVGDKVKIVLMSDKYYASADKNGFASGEKIIMIEEGILEVLVEFKPKVFTLGNKEVSFDKNLMLDLDIGLLRKLDTFSIMIDGKAVDKNLVKITNNSLIIAVDKDFIDTYLLGAGELNFSYTTKLNPGIVAAFAIAGVVVAAVVVLVILYSLAVASKKRKIKIAEKETAEGNARFNAASQFSKFKDEE